MSKHVLVQKLFSNIDALGRAASAQKFAPTAKGAPTHAQVGVLFVVYHHGPQSIKELAAKFGMTPSAATQLVNGLVKEGLLKRTDDVEDRRKTRVELTEKGKDRMVSIKKKRYEVLEQIFQPFSNQELVQLDSLLEKIVKQVQTLWIKNQTK